MKKIIQILLFAYLVVLPVKAQMHLFIEEQSVTIEDGIMSGWVIPIPGTFESAFDNLQAFVKERSDIKLKKEDNMFYMAEKVSIPIISSKRGDLIGYGLSTTLHKDIAIVFRLGYDISLNTVGWKLEMGNLRNYTKEFMTYLYSNFYTDSIAVLEKELKMSKKELEGLEKDLENLERKVEKNQKKIENETDEIKIGELKEEATILKSEIENISYTLPDVQSYIDRLNGILNSVRDELIQVQNAIGAI